MGGFSGSATQEQVIAKSAVAVTNTIDANENILATITLPPLQPNSVIKLRYIGTKTGTNTITLRARLGGIGGTIHSSMAMASPITTNESRDIYNRGATNSQISHALGTAPFGTSAAAITTGAIDTSVSTTLVITAQQNAPSVSAGEVVKLEAYSVSVVY